MGVSSAAVWVGMVQAPWIRQSTAVQRPHGIGPALRSGLWLLLQAAVDISIATEDRSYSLPSHPPPPPQIFLCYLRSLTVLSGTSGALLVKPTMPLTFLLSLPLLPLPPYSISLIVCPMALT